MKPHLVSRHTGKLLPLPRPDNDQTPEDHLHVAAEEQGTLADPLDTLQSPVQTDSMSPKKQSRTKRPSSHDNGRSDGSEMIQIQHKMKLTRKTLLLKSLSDPVGQRKKRTFL